MKPASLFLFLLAACSSLQAGEPPQDAFALALKAMRITPRDLGYRPSAVWSRYPHPGTIPYLLPFFEDLHAAPLQTYEFTRTLGNAVEDLLTPKKLLALPEAKDRQETLFKLGVVLATDRRIRGFRGYSANLDPRPDASEPLLHACMSLLERSGRPLSRPMTFGQVSDDPAPREALRKELAAVPQALRLPLAKLVLNLIEARVWIDRGLRRVTPGMRRKVFATLPHLAEETPDAGRYYPILDDVAAVLDEYSLYYGGLKALQAVQDARRALAGKPTATSSFDFRLETPWGRVRFVRGAGAIEEEEAALCLVVFGGSGRLGGSFAATAPDRSLSVALLLDRAGAVGEAETVDLQEQGGRSRVVAGILGCGVLYASGKKDNSYRTGRWGLGAGLFGLGALVDEGGNDRYTMAAAGEGAAFFGAGLLLDAAGRDTYTLLEGDGQGMGGPGGIGVLADRSGDDSYYAEPDASKAGRADYHSKKAIAANNAQGAAMGRRGDGSDGHCWAGGLGALLDVEGNDHYRAGNFSQGLGYWYGTGLLWDGGGADRYESVYFTQGSGAHFAIGALIDEGGNDVHKLSVTAGAAFAFGWDAVNAFLIDRGRGNDRYEAKIISTGLAEVRSNAFFIDEGGDDTYVLDAKTKGFGEVDIRERYTKPGRTATASFHLPQAGIFLDLGGRDRYLRRDKQGGLAPDPLAADGKRWHVRARDPDAPWGFNLSFAGDFASARAGFLDSWPRRGG